MTEDDLVRIGEGVADDPQFRTNYVAQAIPMIINAQGGRMDEGPAFLVTKQIEKVIDFALMLGATGDQVRRIVARTLIDVMPMSQELHDEISDWYTTREHEDDVIEQMEAQFKDRS